jgi:hypothetical protein
VAVTDHALGAVVHVQGSQLSMMHMAQTAGALPEQGARWTPAELKARWVEIAR